MKRGGEREGLLFAAEIRKTLPGMPILLLTGYPFDAEEVRELVGREVSACLSKTAPVATMIEEVRRLAGESAA
jgi:DNA-binding NarL/FixJ family response regulator